MEKKQSSWVTLILIVVIMLGLVLCFMQYQDYRTVKNMLEQEEMMLAAGKARLASVKELEKQKPQYEADMEVLGQLMPGEPAEDQLIIDLQSGADLAMMEFKQIRFAERVESSGYQEMPLQLLFTGTYHELLYFLDYLQVYERAVRISELRVDQAQGSEDSENDELTVNITASAFFAVE